MKEFGRTIWLRRRALGLTLEELAQRSGLTANYIDAIEIGRRTPSLSTLVQLALGLGVSIGEIVGEVQDRSAPTIEAARLIDWPPDGPPLPPQPPSPPRRGAPGARMPRPVEPHRPPLPLVAWKLLRTAAS